MHLLLMLNSSLPNTLLRCSIKRLPEWYVVPPTRMILLAPRFKQWMGESTFPFCWLDEISRFSSPTKFSAIGILNFFYLNFYLCLLIFDFLWYSCWSLWWLWLVFDGMMCREFFCTGYFGIHGQLILQFWFILYSNCLIKFPNVKTVSFLKNFGIDLSWNLLITMRKA